jgi:two-component system sensor histidine kinase/response regulator
MTNTLGSILVVDDTLDNLRLLSTILTEQGYKVRKALNGQIALNTARMVPPDLILLDINMPGMNGYEVCQSLKGEEKTQAIPVIFISALDDVLDKVKAFQVGGVDYITKPFHREEVLARVKNHLTILLQQKQLRCQNEQLQQEICDRQKAEDALKVYLHAVSHDLRNPVIGMSLVLKNLLKHQLSTSPSQEELTRPSPQKALSVPRSILERMESSCDRQLHLIDSLVETQQFEIWGVPLHCQPLQLYRLTQQLVAEWKPILDENQATLEDRVAPDLPSVNADSYQLWRVFENLIANALKHNPPGIILAISAEVDSPAQMIRCVVTDNGVGISAEQSEHLFERYQRGSNAQRTLGLGLGLYLCRQIITAHGGEIGAIAGPNSGTQFWFTLPIFANS